MAGRLTTHVLDLSRGIPARGMQIELWRILQGEAAAILYSFETNEDGRTEAPLLEKDTMLSGSYELVFEVGRYFRSQGIESLFLEQVPVRFQILDPQSHYHVPLLVAPGGYSTYRGS
ncbi:hydroxyisourate hydrolase [Paenibacillus sp. GP183]|jgi:5-hydroxyisourate hydrolase|uniref:hydroxyisourate hydrolase n=1 Tax=Paenibacillus sp. GP183 TaxID=1882751 RepID=UPI00089CDA63|nr:hydroxyisourate hydrolase [Paenibacillus sp. GP183]SEB52111.1 5-hydroxyisourate hydrolase [Paenibacillus sp. GP183]